MVVAAAVTSWGREVAAGGGSRGCSPGSLVLPGAGGSPLVPVTFPRGRALLFGSYRPCRGERRRNEASAAPRRELCQLGGWHGEREGRSERVSVPALSPAVGVQETCHFSSPALAEPLPGLASSPPSPSSGCFCCVQSCQQPENLPLV